MTPEQARAAAHAEGLVLLPAENPTGFKGVNLGSTVSRPSVAQMWNGSPCPNLGTFAAGEGAALPIPRRSRGRAAAPVPEKREDEQEAHVLLQGHQGRRAHRGAEVS